MRRSRLWIRELTHTLNLPPELAEADDGLSRTWLLEVLEYLPRLQSLLVLNLPFFDHSALTALSNKRGADESLRTTYSLRLLLADREPNATPTGLCEALSHFSRLVFLDLSHTTAARDHCVLTALSRLPNLQVLKLRGIGLRDSDAGILTDTIGTRVRLLDLRDNILSDNALEFLIQRCFLPSTWPEQLGRYQFEWRLPAVPFGNILTIDSLKSEHLDEHFRSQLTMPLDGWSAMEDIPHVGITHLYIADNRVSAQGLLNILRTCRLRVLDVGNVCTYESPKRRQNPRQGSERVVYEKLSEFTSAGTFIFMLCESAAKSLTYLRIHHAVVTKSAPFQESEPSAEGDVEPEVPFGERQRISSDPVSALELEDTSISPRAQGSDSKPPFSHARNSLIQELLSKRPPALQRNTTHNNMAFLHPSNLPNLRTLVLTDVPSYVPASSSILSSIKRFITACADEALLASLQAQSEYSLPPGWHRARAEKQHAKSLFALERLVLEITPDTEPHGASAWVPSSFYTAAHSKSSTGDRDSENLWTAARHDFSFFGGEGNGDAGKGPGGTTEARVDLVAALAAFRKEKREEFNDLVHKQRQAPCRDEMTGEPSFPLQSTITTHVEGHWQGEVKVVKSPAPVKRRA